MSGRLAGKVAIVAGAGASGAVIGNGQATAILFAREGAKVLCADAVEERISVRADVLEVTEEQWDRVMAVNVKSIMLASKYAIPQMVKAGGGSIINISSVAGLRANQSTPYTTSKAAVIGLTRSMAGDHGRDGIRVNCILPGLIYGPMTAPRMDEDIRRKRREAGALGTEGTGWDVAHAAVFLASDESRWITGVALPVDAGFLVMSPTTSVRLAQQKL